MEKEEKDAHLIQRIHLISQPRIYGTLGWLPPRLSLPLPHSTVKDFILSALWVPLSYGCWVISLAASRKGWAPPRQISRAETRLPWCASADCHLAHYKWIKLSEERQRNRLFLCPALSILLFHFGWLPLDSWRITCLWRIQQTLVLCIMLMLYSIFLSWFATLTSLQAH